jgi:uncharacterized membrane protein HdeD (DUF308 family)
MTSPPCKAEQTYRHDTNFAVAALPEFSIVSPKLGNSADLLDRWGGRAYPLAGLPKEVRPVANINVLMHSRSWWALIVRGLAAAVFGIIAIAHPGGTADFVIRLLGVLILIAGIVGLVAALRQRDEAKKSDWLVIPTAIAIILGLILVLIPGAIASFFIFLVGLGVFVYGIWEIYRAFRVRKDVANEWMPFLIAAVAIIIGIILMAANNHIADALMWLLGVFALVLGVLWIVMGVRMRGWGKQVEPPPGTPVQPAK